MAETLKISTYGQGTPIVLLHGWGLNSGIWQPTVHELAKYFQVVTVDLPGFGLNQQYSPNQYNIGNIATLVEQAVFAEVEQAAIYLGWSLGGLVATQIALQAPEKVLKLVNVCSSPFFVEQENWPGIKPQVLAAFHQQLATDSHKTIDGFLKIQAMGSPHIRQDVKQIKSLIMNYPFPETITLDKALNLLEVVDHRPALKDLRMPSLRLYGRLDSLVPRKLSEMVTALEATGIKGHSFTFDKSSHAPFISEPQAFIKVLIDWLQS